MPSLGHKAACRKKNVNPASSRTRGSICCSCPTICARVSIQRLHLLLLLLLPHQFQFQPPRDLGNLIHRGSGDAAFRSCLSLIFLPSQQDHCSAEATTIPPPITEPIFIMSAASNQAQDANPHMDLDPKYDDYDFPTTAPEARPGHPGHTTKEQDAQVHQLRAMLEQDGYKERLDTLTLLRFLRARKFNVQLAKEMCGTAPLAR